MILPLLLIGYLIHLVHSSDVSTLPSNAALLQTLQLLQGVGIVYQFHSNQTVQINYQVRSQQKNKQSKLFLFVNLLDSEASQLPQLSFSVTVKVDDNAEPINIPTKFISESDIDFSVSIPLIQGNYHILVVSDQTFTANMMISQQQIDYLRPYNSLPTLEDKTYSIYSQKSAVIEIFICSGEVYVEGSTQLKDITELSNQSKETRLSLRTPNYGGHYLIDTGNVGGNYFVKVNKKDENSSYMITHNYYDEQDIVLYKVVHLPDPSISYYFVKDNITFSFAPTMIDKDKIQYSLIEYRLFISISRDSLTKYASCRDTYIYFLRNVTQNNNANIQFSIKNQTLIEDVENYGIQVFYITAEARVYLDPKEQARKDLHYPPQLRMIYDVLQLKSEELFKAQEEGHQKLKISIIMVILAAGVIYFKRFRSKNKGEFLSYEENSAINQIRDINQQV